MAGLQYQQAFGSHIEQQVRDAQVGQEAQPFLEHLVIGLRAEVGVLRAEVLLGVDAFAEVVFAGSEGGLVVRGAFHLRFQPDERADQAAQGFVEVGQELVLLFVEGAEVVLVVFEERGMVVGRFQSIPVQVAPVAVVGDADVLHGALQRVRLDDGHRERQRAVRRGNGAAVAVGLLQVVVAVFHIDAVVGQ